ncbi:MAG: carbohydrate kinase family protein [Eubacteriales bacterium]|nr:carbohydrate kinase family protein [Eubacteriales bacterium]
MGEQKKYDVICVGQVVQDILVTGIPQDAFVSGKDTVLAKTLTLGVGGDAANESAILGKLGDHVALLARLDRRNVGDMIYEDMKREHVDPALIIRPDDCETFSTVVVIHPDGNHSFMVGPGKNFNLEWSDIDLEVFKETRAVTAASLLALGELDTNGIDRIFTTAQENGALTIADMSFDMRGIGPHGVDHVFPHVDYLMPSLDEAVYVTGSKDPDEIADYFLAAGVKNVLLKLGGEGCFFKNHTERFFTDPFEVTPVDTTGCGDNFVAAFTHCLLKGLSHQECAEFASATGALNSQGIGAHTFVQSEEQVLEFMKTAPKRVIKRD